jgi:hypothetical protein
VDSTGREFLFCSDEEFIDYIEAFKRPSWWQYFSQISASLSMRVDVECIHYPLVIVKVMTMGNIF